MRRITLTLLCTLSLSACFNVSRPVNLPDGSAGHTVTRCRSLAACMAKAEQLCGGPYDIKSQSESFHNGFTLMVGCKAK